MADGFLARSHFVPETFLRIDGRGLSFDPAAIFPRDSELPLEAFELREPGFHVVVIVIVLRRMLRGSFPGITGPIQTLGRKPAQPRLAADEALDLDQELFPLPQVRALAGRAGGGALTLALSR